MPECSCTTLLITNPKAQELDNILNEIEEERMKSFVTSAAAGSSTCNTNNQKKKKVSNKIVDDTTMLDVLLHHSTFTLENIHPFPQKGMCKQCVQSQMKASNEVFQDGTETNVTVATKCPHCSKNFSSRTLKRRLDQCIKLMIHNFLFTRRGI